MVVQGPDHASKARDFSRQSGTAEDPAQGRARAVMPRRTTELESEHVPHLVRDMFWFLDVPAALPGRSPLDFAGSSRDHQVADSLDRVEEPKGLPRAATNSASETTGATVPVVCARVESRDR